MYPFEVKADNGVSVQSLVDAMGEGIPVTLTSHPGNASLYKLSLWSCGIPDNLWDITCIAADRNNQPEHRLVRGEKELLISEELRREVATSASRDRRFVTAYQRTEDGEFLGRVHTRAMQTQYPGVISSQSALLLSERERVAEIFGYLAARNPKKYFPRHISCDGVMMPVREYLSADGIAHSALSVIEELSALLLSDEIGELRGGFAYGGPVVHMICALCQYWKTGSIKRYDVSGPDMIRYAVTAEHQGNLSSLLVELHRAFPSLVPEKFSVTMPAGTVFRVGQLTDGHPSAGVSDLHDTLLEQQAIRRGRANGTRLSETAYGELRKKAIEVEQEWPLNIEAPRDAYFSQHDLCRMGARITVPEQFRSMTFAEIAERRVRLKNILRV